MNYWKVAGYQLSLLPVPVCCSISDKWSSAAFRMEHSCGIWGVYAISCEIPRKPQLVDFNNCSWHHLHFQNLNLQTWILMVKNDSGLAQQMPMWVSSHNIMRALHFQLSTLNPWCPHKVCKTHSATFLLRCTHWPNLHRLNRPGQPSPNTKPSSYMPNNESFLSFCASLSEKGRQNSGAKNAYHTPNTMQRTTAAVETPWYNNWPTRVCPVSSFSPTVLLDPDHAREGAPLNCWAKVMVL
jgi:hypothetical protein